MDAGVENTGADTMLSLDERLVDDHTALVDNVFHLTPILQFNDRCYHRSPGINQQQQQDYQ